MVIFGRSTVAVLLIMFYLNVHSLLLVQKSEPLVLDHQRGPERLFLSCSTVDILRIFSLNVLFLSGAKERGQKESARHIPWCLIPARVVGACRTRRFAAQTASARTPPPLAFMSVDALSKCLAGKL